MTQQAHDIKRMDDVDDVPADDIRNIVAMLPARAKAVVNPMPPVRCEVGNSSEAYTQRPYAVEEKKKSHQAI